MNKAYIDTVRLLLKIAPTIFKQPHLALKGGTALNLFLHDMPRLSVDIDVVYTDHNKNRNQAISSIADSLKMAYNNEFVGMTRETVSLNGLLDTRSWVGEHLIPSLSDNH